MVDDEKIKVGIIGGSGYGGSELLRILLFHPNAVIEVVTANEQSGKMVGEVHRNLNGLTSLRFEPSPRDPADLERLDVVFLALPHGNALDLVPKLPRSLKVIDLSGDFRIDDPETFTEFYKLDHPGALQKEFVYGLTETNREAIRTAAFIANPGCFATATIIALAPFVKSGLSLEKIVVDAKTGSSGSGAKPAANTHHPQRSNSFYAYKPFVHQHLPEIEQHLRSLSEFPCELTFMTHSMPVSRGIFVSCYLQLNEEIAHSNLSDQFKSFYGDSFFIRLVEGSPDINWVKNTNFCDVAVHVQGRNLVIFSAIDNLVKGAAGQAVQNMNLMFGLDEKTGLVFPGGNP